MDFSMTLREELHKFGAELPGKEYNIHCADEFTVPEEMILNAEMTANAAIEICK